MRVLIYLIPFISPVLVYANTVTGGAAISSCSAGSLTVGKVLCLIKENALKGVLILLYAASILIGLGLLVTGIFKLKQVKDNPTQIPVSTPLAFFVSGSLLLFMPNLFPVVRTTVFGDATSAVSDELSDNMTITPITNLLDSTG